LLSASFPIETEKGFRSFMSVAWSEQLHVFINGRLRTTPYRLAVKQQPLVIIPQVPLNTQFLLDGIAMAIHDRGDLFGRETFLAVTNHLKSTSGRWMQVAQYVTENCGGSSVVHVSQQHRRFTYGAMAALQDLLLAWYVVDVVLKHVDAKSVAFSLLAEELPHLITTHMPLLCATTVSTSASTYIVAAVREYRGRFEDLMATWYMDPTIHRAGIRDVLRRSEEVLKRVLTRPAAVAVSVGPDGRAAQAANSSVVIGNDLLSLIRSALAGTLSMPTVSKPATKSQVPKLSGKALVDVYIQQAFERSRGQLSCKQCGALFPSETSLAAHFPTHFATYEQRDTDTAVRLRFPSADDVLQHCPVWSANAGAAVNVPVKFFCKTTEAHKPFFSATVAVRKGKANGDGEGGAPGGGGKRPRGTEGVVVTDVAAEYRCSVCGEGIRPMQDVYSRDWVLPNATKLSNGAVVHLGCRDA
jgi:hypothetical protein